MRVNKHRQSELSL